MSRPSDTGRIPVSDASSTSPPVPSRERSNSPTPHLPHAPHVRYASQPIIDRTGRVVATELLFRWNGDDGPVGPELGAHATAAVLSNALIDGALLTSATAAEHPLGDLLVNMDGRTLMGPIAEAMTPDVGVIELLETVEVDTALMRRIEDLHGRGYRFALDDIVSLDDPRWALAPWAQFAKIDMLGLAPLALRALIRHAHQLGLAVIAEKVDDDEAHQRALRAGADFFQGYGIARPATVAVPALPETDARVVAQLLQLAASGACTATLAMVAGLHPSLVARLLRVQEIHAAQSVATSESLAELLASLPRPVLVAWLSVFGLAAIHGREHQLSALLREELAQGQRRLKEQGRVRSPTDADRASFYMCRQLLRMRLRQGGRNGPSAAAKPVVRRAGPLETPRL